jgi:hypothetical protein
MLTVSFGVQMGEVDIRRLLISDEQWKRTSASWKELKPKKNFNEIDLSDEFDF